VQEALNESGTALRGAKVLVLGVAFKPNVRDYRESPALECIRGLVAGGAEVSYADPHVPEIKEHGLDMKAGDLTPESMSAADCVLILTDHDVVDYASVAEHAGLVMDTRNALGRRGHTGQNVRRL
jgi:UDP-N-acetyl-D-glucosamine dehydrogenase